MIRRNLTKREKLAMLAAQRWLCACGCGRPLWPGSPAEYDHTVPVALGNTAKPDKALAPFCHKPKTARDVRQIRKADRLRAKAQRKEKAGTFHSAPANVRKRKLQGRGFTAWRGMDGSIRSKC